MESDKFLSLEIDETDFQSDMTMIDMDLKIFLLKVKLKFNFREAMAFLDKVLACCTGSPGSIPLVGKAEVSSKSVEFFYLGLGK